jgi:hypothetical protein
MAINDTENPEEGTPRSKKDIRRERRQMRAVNRERKSMGGDVLYKAEDFKAIKKPYQGGPGETSRAIAAEETKPDVEYIKYEPSGYPTISKERFEVEKKDNVGAGRDFADYDSYLKNLESKEKTYSTGTIKGGTKEAEDISSATEGDEQAGLRVAKLFAATPNSATTTENVIQTKAGSDNTLTSSQVDDMNKASLVAGKKVQEENQKIDEEALNAKNALSGIADLTQMPPGTPDDWVNTYVTEGFEPEDKNTIIDRAAAAAKKRAPQLAIEKLGVQDYYPEIGRDIAVGTFSGSRIGSQTIYSGAGGLLPLGLYDARKRAIAADIKKKEALMDQLKEMPDIAKQYKPAFAQNFYEGLMNYVDAYKDNPEGLASDPGYLKFMSTQKGVAENFSKTSAYLSDLEEKLVDPKTGSPAAWVTKGMLKIINNVKTGMVPGKVEDYFSGKKNIAKVLNTVRALPDALKQADDIIETLISKGGVETAINLKTGKEFTEKDIADLNSLVQQIKSPSVDYEMFAELRKKYFDFEYDVMAKEWVEMHMADQPQSIKDEVQKSMSNYIESQMPDDAIISTITKQTNNYTTRRGQDLDYQKAMARINADKEMFYADFNRHTSITRALYEGMERLGSNDESVEIYDAGVNGKNGLEMEWQVYDSKDKAYKWVKGKDINANTNRYYKSDKVSPNNVYTAKSIVHVQPTKNNMQKSGSNYNVSTYGVAYESFIDMGDGSKVGATQINVPVRTPYAVGAKFQRTAGNIYAGGGKGRTGGSNSQYSRE